MIAFSLFAGLVVAAWSTVWIEGPVPGAHVVQRTPAEQAVADLDPRRTADELFNQIVDAAAAGDTMSVFAFLPLAVDAYGEAGAVDPDALFHVSTLFRIGDQPEEALRSAEAILAKEPDHILGLSAAADAELALGRRRQAVERYDRIVAVYDAQVRRELPEYVSHAGLIERIRSEAAPHAER